MAFQTFTTNGGIGTVGAGTKAEWRRNKSGMGENRRVEAWAARLAFFAPGLRIVAQLEGMKKSNLTTASLPSLSASFSAIGVSISMNNIELACLLLPRGRG